MISGVILRFQDEDIVGTSDGRAGQWQGSIRFTPNILNSRTRVIDLEIEKLKVYWIFVLPYNTKPYRSNWASVAMRDLKKPTFR